jgi:zinc/manganese transport system substrate-binding protein
MTRYIVLLLALTLTSAPAFADAQPLKVVVTFSIIGDLTKQVGGSMVDVKTLVGPNSDTHTYKPTPNDSKALAQADLVIENGLGFEGWIDRLISASGYKGPVIIASTSISSHQMNADGEKITDPHAWQDVSNVRIYVKNINAALDKALPAKAPFFDTNAKTYDAELRKLDTWVKEQIEEVPVSQRKIITSHDAFGYFGIAYGITFMAPEGISTESEPTATQVGKLIEQIQTEKVKRLFFENMASSKLVSQLAKDTGASIGKPIYSDALSPPNGPASTYREMFYYNVAQFKEAMLLNGK